MRNLVWQKEVYPRNAKAKNEETRHNETSKVEC
jgi:hypothetical protein